MPVKEYPIVDFFLGSALKDEVMKIMPVQKQTRAGQRTRFKVHGSSMLAMKIFIHFTIIMFPDVCLMQLLNIKELLVLVQAFVVVGDSNGHVGLGVKCAKEVSRSRHPLKHSEAAFSS